LLVVEEVEKYWDEVFGEPFVPHVKYFGDHLQTHRRAGEKEDLAPEPASPGRTHAHTELQKGKEKGSPIEEKSGKRERGGHEVRIYS
jgi:hypothetical protein